MYWRKENGHKVKEKVQRQDDALEKSSKEIYKSRKVRQKERFYLSNANISKSV